jgi:hypothetical protein
MKKIFLILSVLLLSYAGISQETNQTVKDSTANESKFSASIDITYPYFWRGIRYYGNKIAFQPCVEYAFSDKLSFELWATTNFSNANDAYNEFDWTIYYQISPVINLSLSDYYWPATSNNTDWEKSNYFDYSEGSSKTLDLSILFDFSDKGVPIDFLWSTFIGGNDFNYDEEENPTSRAFSSYAEVGYNYTLKKTAIDFRTFVGAVVINGGKYGIKADGSTGFSFTNVGVDISKEFSISKNYSVPIFIRYSFNDIGIQEFDDEGNLINIARNFFSCGLTFKLL